MTRLSTKRYNNRITSLRKGDVCWTRALQFDNIIGCKRRPVVIMGITSDGAVKCRKCTTNGEGLGRKEIIDTVTAGLDKRTFVSNEDLLVPMNRISWIMGHLSKEDEDWICA